MGARSWGTGNAGQAVCPVYIAHMRVMKERQCAGSKTPVKLKMEMAKKILPSVMKCFLRNKIPN